MKKRDRQIQQMRGVSFQRQNLLDEEREKNREARKEIRALQEHIAGMRLDATPAVERTTQDLAALADHLGSAFGELCVLYGKPTYTDLEEALAEYGREEEDGYNTAEDLGEQLVKVQAELAEANRRVDELLAEGEDFDKKIKGLAQENQNLWFKLNAVRSAAS